MKEWATPDNNGIIHVPDELDPLINKLAHHVRVHTISKATSEVEMICRIAAASQEFFEKQLAPKSEFLTISEFEALKEGDWVACEFHRDVYPKKIRFGVFQICLMKPHRKEIILDKKDNVYFNYEMFLNGEGNLKSIKLIKPSDL